jgi:hypothetical protein
MFVHLVLIKLKPGITRNDPRVRTWQTQFSSLERKCKGITRFEHGWNTTDRPTAYDYGISMVFKTRADLDAYGPHPAHQESVATMREIGDWVICDFEKAERLPGDFI